MLAGASASALLRSLSRPDLRVVAEGRQLVVGPLSEPFRIAKCGPIMVNEVVISVEDGHEQAFVVRHALELAELLQVEAGEGSPASETSLSRACFAAARTAALFRELEVGHETTASPTWVGPMAAPVPPSADDIRNLWPALSATLAPEWEAPSRLADVEGLRRWLCRVWALLGPAETLMAAGGDARLQLDPRNGLNHYGCSHRPRPWAVTFASSTASSVSERGFAGAENARLRLQKALLRDEGARCLALLGHEVRGFLARYFGLPDGDHIVLAPSGTDCELAALAVTLLAPGCRAVTNILVAPEETGRGVPLAAGGRHFAEDTARHTQVCQGDVIDGFDSASVAAGGQRVEVETVALRDEDGRTRTAAAIADTCRRLIADAAGRGRRTLLHQVDLSKTGLIAPDGAALDALEEEFGPALDVVVDACQARLVPARVGGWVAHGRAVMVTGSKFVTGPPFCGALLLPVSWRKRLDHGVLPAGLADYMGRPAWPDCAAARHLPEEANYGLILRWHAAMAEMAAFAAVPMAETRRRLACFLQGVKDALSSCSDVRLLAPPEPWRPVLADGWDDMATILCFLVRAPGQEGPFIPMDVEEARQLYRWLNTDLTSVLRGHLRRQEVELAGLLCHIGQPVAVPSPALAGAAGALRISAGARLVSGEPSHEGMATDVRLARETADAALVLAKIGLIRRHWLRISAADPLPTYAPHAVTARVVNRIEEWENR